MLNQYGLVVPAFGAKRRGPEGHAQTKGVVYANTQITELHSTDAANKKNQYVVNNMNDFFI